MTTLMMMHLVLPAPGYYRGPYTAIKPPVTSACLSSSDKGQTWAVQKSVQFSTLGYAVATLHPSTIVIIGGNSTRTFLSQIYFF